MDPVGERKTMETDMRLFAAREAKQRLGAVLDAARDGPVAIIRNGRRAGVVISARLYEELAALKLARQKATLAERLARFAEAQGKVSAGEVGGLLADLPEGENDATSNGSELHPAGETTAREHAR